MGKIVVGYWDIHGNKSYFYFFLLSSQIIDSFSKKIGLASMIRFLLEVAGADYEDETYTIETKDEWFNNKKKNLGMFVYFTLF